MVIDYGETIQRQDSEKEYQKAEKESRRGFQTDTNEASNEAKESHWHSVEDRERSPNG
jgi:hypothetical protein